MKYFFSNFLDNYIFKYLRRIPGEQRFGSYRFLPFFFLTGAGLEFVMINWKVGPNQVNFCNKQKRTHKYKLS
jgi:hypothetical protein